MKLLLNILALLIAASALQAQMTLEQPPATPAEVRLEGYEARKALMERSIVSEVPFENIGPSVFSGRVDDLEVSPEDPTHFYVAYASGGLWKTENNGMTFTPIFDNEVVMTLGDIAVDWKNDVIWAGTGEVNSSRSSYSGVGIFKSSDGGKTWEHKGLPESHHIGRIILHPTDPNTLWVAVLGHLYSPNEERGVYKTTNGGTTWEKVLYVSENAGAVDMIIDPDDPNTLYAAMWERTRRAWDFTESGEGSGIYKSTDGGTNWTRLNNEKSGFPTGEGVGRIGLDLVKSDEKTIVYAILDNYFRRPEEKKDDEKSGLTKDDLRTMDKAAFLKLDKKEISAFLKDNGFPKTYSASKVSEMVKSDKIKPIALVEYLEDANSLLFDTPVIGAEVYRSDDEGKSWSKTHDNYLDAVYNSYGYYFGQIRVHPNNPEKLYIMGVPVLRSDDAGKTWQNIMGDNVHSDHHALWINPDRAGHLVLGNDGGVNISYDDGATWNKCNTPPVGQFYYIAVDHAKNYNVYGGLQDNGVWMGPNSYKASNGWEANGQYPYKRIMGGDGMQVAVDTRDNATVYTGFQFGNYFRINTETDERKYITPKHELGDRPLRWNWQTPVHLSIHNQDILYMGSNKVHRSFNQGDDFEEISEDLTTGGRKGDVAFSTLSTIHESPLRFGLLYVGSDDGLVHISKDAGTTWENITEGLPKGMWVARIQASAHDEATVYVALNGYRWDDFKPYVYKSTDYGTTWQAIGKDLPLEPVNVIKEDLENPNVLYVGTDHGLYVSLDGGAQFMLMNKDLPAVAIHDVVIHPKTHDLLVGTHGRSIYKASAKELQQLTNEVTNKELHVFKTNKVRKSNRWGNARATWMKPYEPTAHIPFYSKSDGDITMSLHPKSDKATVLKSWKTAANKGLNYAEYDLTFNAQQQATLQKMLENEGDKTKLKKADNGKLYLPKGEYVVLLKKGSSEEEMVLTVE